MPEEPTYLQLLAQLARRWRERATRDDLNALSAMDAQLIDAMARVLTDDDHISQHMARLAAADSLERAGRDAARAQDELRRAVTRFRERGGTWAAVGAMFGISRQAAAKRFAPDDPGRRFEAPLDVTSSSTPAALAP